MGKIGSHTRKARDPEVKVLSACRRSRSASSMRATSSSSSKTSVMAISRIQAVELLGQGGTVNANAGR